MVCFTFYYLRVGGNILFVAHITIQLILNIIILNNLITAYSLFKIQYME
jgi:hypothetical protein